MDTGSGKTQMWEGQTREFFWCWLESWRALLRICTEVDRLSSGKAMNATMHAYPTVWLVHQIIWFLAPSVALCEQQHRTIISQLPAVRTKLLLGSDNVDRWGEQSVWDAVLSGLHVVVSTHAILSDALGHGFVRMRDLALIIFDEGKMVHTQKTFLLTIL